MVLAAANSKVSRYGLVAPDVTWPLPGFEEKTEVVYIFLLKSEFPKTQSVL